MTGNLALPGDHGIDSLILAGSFLFVILLLEYTAGEMYIYGPTNF